MFHSAGDIFFKFALRLNQIVNGADKCVGSVTLFVGGIFLH